MSFNNEEIKWLDRYENRFVEKGMDREDAIAIRNSVSDIDLTSEPEDCADDDMSIIIQDCEEPK
jgi:hypothetical protein